MESNNAVKKRSACIFRISFINIFIPFFIQYTPVNFETSTYYIKYNFKFPIFFYFLFFFYESIKNLHRTLINRFPCKKKLKYSQIRNIAIKWFVLFIDSVVFELHKNVLTLNILTRNVEQTICTVTIYYYCFAFLYLSTNLNLLKYFFD
jgi:hypothetical protein